VSVIEISDLWAEIRIVYLTTEMPLRRCDENDGALIDCHFMHTGKNKSNFSQITGIQEKLDTICKQNAS
jgi:hypothetical protein